MQNNNKNEINLGNHNTERQIDSKISPCPKKNVGPKNIVIHGKISKLII